MRVATRPDNPVDALGMLAGLVPRPLFEGYFGLMMSRALMAGVSLGIFDALDEEPDDAAGLARRLGLDAAGVDALCVGLRSMGYLELRDGRYRNGRQARKHLIAGAEEPMVEVVGSFAYDMWDLFGGLEEAVRTGEPAGIHDPAPDDPWWERYMRGLFEISQLRAGPLVKLIGAKAPLTLLDVAGGHGGYSVAMCRKHAELTATVIELEGAARIGERIVAEQGFADRVSYRIGDMFADELGSGYDVAMANSILHHFDGDRNVELLGRIHDALRPGGTVAVIEQERPPDGERGDQIGALTGILFYVSSKARTYTADELESFLARAGFAATRARRSVLVPGVVVVTGRKEDAA